ncbi:MAG: hypothetical protein KatS3mg036_0499 [Ignavibacterium sp.]|uniref:phage major capsid protein n=1 Tax=Ignavibacterium sp. TaxID=2651167 RepID=UPI0021DD0E48|nr:hypothetical protein [Ignavibacterium sp.]BDQ01945.1 MAG: hypothetical protein KatS3mg037_0520 [Ignavibacterium sp.]GIV45681.1 MAG: hypothetical protein KatS3mg036_0499 [Ignavibacterium sp.]
MSTTLATLSGLQDKIIADSTALFRLRSDLFNAVYTQSAGSASVVQFMSSGVPGAATKQAVENTDVTPTVVTISDVPAQLETYPILVRSSKISIAAPNAELKIAEQLAGGIARTVDTIIAQLFNGFSNAVGDNATDVNIDSFFTAVAKLDESGYVGDKVAVLHPMTWKKIGKDILGLSGAGNKANEYLTRGYIANVGGVDIYVSPWVDASGQYTNGVYFKEALGLGYREPVIDIESMPNLEKVAVDFLATAFLKAVELTDAAGVKLIDKLVV